VADEGKAGKVVILYDEELGRMQDKLGKP